jgi:hypothetical protein
MGSSRREEGTMKAPKSPPKSPQISVSGKVYDRLKLEARARGVSIAHLVEAAVAVDHG